MDLVNYRVPKKVDTVIISILGDLMEKVDIKERRQFEDIVIDLRNKINA